MFVPQHVGSTLPTVIQTFGLHCASESHSALGVRRAAWVVVGGGSSVSAWIGEDHVGVDAGRLVRGLLRVDDLKEISEIEELAVEDKAEDSSLVPLSNRKGDVLGVYKWLGDV